MTSNEHFFNTFEESLEEKSANGIYSWILDYFTNDLSNNKNTSTIKIESYLTACKDAIKQSPCPSLEKLNEILEWIEKEKKNVYTKSILDLDKLKEDIEEIISKIFCFGKTFFISLGDKKISKNKQIASIYSIEFSIIERNEKSNVIKKIGEYELEDIGLIEVIYEDVKEILKKKNVLHSNCSLQVLVRTLGKRRVGAVSGDSLSGAIAVGIFSVLMSEIHPRSEEFYIPRHFLTTLAINNQSCKAVGGFDLKRQIFETEWKTNNQDAKLFYAESQQEGKTLKGKNYIAVNDLEELIYMFFKKDNESSVAFWERCARKHSSHHPPDEPQPPDQINVEPFFFLAQTVVLFSTSKMEVAYEQFKNQSTKLSLEGCSPEDILKEQFGTYCLKNLVTQISSKHGKSSSDLFQLGYLVSLFPFSFNNSEEFRQLRLTIEKHSINSDILIPVIQIITEFLNQIDESINIEEFVLKVEQFKIDLQKSFGVLRNSKTQKKN